MALIDKKITGYTESISSLPDKIEKSATQLKAMFDSRTNNEVKQSINGIVDELVHEQAAGQIGAVVPQGVAATGNVQSVLQGLNKRILDEVYLTGAADMTKAVYDPNDNGKVNACEVADNAGFANNGFAVYTHAKEGVQHNFVGVGENGKMLVTAEFVDGDEIKINDVLVAKITGAEVLNADNIGTWVTFIFDGTQINFKTGGTVSIPDGLTVLPVDDKDIWLRCVGITSKKTLQEVVQDLGLCATLMATKNAVEYMIRSTQIQTAVLASSIATSALDYSLPFATPYMTSATTPYGVVSHYGYPENTWMAFGNAGSAAPGQLAGSWARYNFQQSDKFKWIYKVVVDVSYANQTSQYKVQGVLEDGGFVDLTPAITAVVGEQKITFCLPNIKKVVGVRILKISGDAMYLAFSRAWGK